MYNIYIIYIYILHIYIPVYYMYIILYIIYIYRTLYIHSCLEGLQKAADLLKQFGESEDEAPVVTRLAQFDMKNGPTRQGDYGAAASSAPHAAPSAPNAAPSAPDAAPSAPNAAPSAPNAAPRAPNIAPSAPSDEDDEEMRSMRAVLEQCQKDLAAELQVWFIVIATPL